MLYTNLSVARMLYLEKATSHTGLKKKRKKYIDTLSYKPLLTTNRSLRNQRIQFGRLPARPHYSSIDGRPEQTVLRVRQ
jgi:hypothetical protein